MFFKNKKVFKLLSNHCLTQQNKFKLQQYVTNISCSLYRLICNVAVIVFVAILENKIFIMCKKDIMLQDCTLKKAHHNFITSFPCFPFCWLISVSVLVFLYFSVCCETTLVATKPQLIITWFCNSPRPHEGVLVSLSSGFTLVLQLSNLLCCLTLTCLIVPFARNKVQQQTSKQIHKRRKADIVSSYLVNLAFSG